MINLDFAQEWSLCFNRQEDSGGKHFRHCVEASTKGSADFILFEVVVASKLVLVTMCGRHSMGPRVWGDLFDVGSRIFNSVANMKPLLVLVQCFD